MHRISYAESVRLLRQQCATLHGAAERIRVRDALGRVLVDAVSATRSNPNEALAAMDGIAIDFRSASSPPAKLRVDQWRRINTGEAIPPGFNCIVKIEDVRWDGDQPILEKPVVFFQNIRSVAEDFAAEDFLFPAGHQLDPQDLSLLLAGGIDEVQVHRAPAITFIPTGSELVSNAAQATKGQIPESNSAMIGGLVSEWGGVLRVMNPVADQQEALSAAIRSALSESDIIVLSAGTSMGTRDLTAEVLQSLGQIHFHGVAIHPARPVLLAQIGDVPVLGLPGYPSAAYLAAVLYLQPLVCALSGRIPPLRQEVHIAAEEIAPRSEDAFYRVQCFDVDGRVYVRKISKGTSSILALSRMDGWMHVPANAKITKRDAVRVDLLHNRAIGSIAGRGIAHAYSQRLFDLLHSAMPDRRVLFWSSSQEDALESIIERNAHIALLATHSGHDLFPPFAERLRDWMLRYRLFTRWFTLLLRPGLETLPAGASIAIPESMLNLWMEFVSQEELPADVRKDFVATPEKELVRAVDAGSWDAVFADVTLSHSGIRATRTISMHYDLVVSDAHAQTDPGIKKLIEIALSPEYEDWLGRRGAFDPAARGLVQENTEC